jgi:hypothetical protein
MASTPPLIPDNSNYNDNYSSTLQTNKIFCDMITDGTATLSSGTMSNITWTPIVGSDAITKSYITGTAPEGPLQSLQFNSNGVFGGSSNLIFNNNQLIATCEITDGTLTIVDNTIGSLVNPVSNQQIATKAYVDSFSNKIQVTEILTNAGVTYTSASVTGAVIVRNSTVVDTTVTDTMPTATSIINHLIDEDISVVIGTPFKFILMNTKYGTESNNFNILLNPGTGITFNPTGTVYIPQNYVLNSTLLIDNVGTPAITMNINSIGPGSNYVTKYFYDYGFGTSEPYKISNMLLFPMDENSNETVVNYTYTESDIKNSLIVRNPASNSSDIITNLTNVSSGSFVIQNISTNSITLQETGSWIFRITTASLIPTGYSIVIGPSQNGNFLYQYSGTDSFLTVIGVS